MSTDWQKEFGIVIEHNPRVFIPEEEVFDFDPSLLELDPVAGAPVLGTLTDDEQKLYRIMCGIEAAQDEINEELTSAININLARFMTENDGHISHDTVAKIVNAGYRERVEEAFRLDLLWTKVSSEFWFRIRTRLQTFATFLSIRSGYTVCKTGDRFNG